MKNNLAMIMALLGVAACTGAESDGAASGEPGTGGGPPVDEPPAALDCATQSEKCFVRVQGGRFVLDGQDYRYMGTNFWAAPYISPERLRAELDILKAQGVKNLRLLALSEGGIPDAQLNDAQLGPQRIMPASSDSPCLDDAMKAYVETLRGVLDEVHRHGMKAVLTLNNWYHWSGGMPQYIKWAHEQPELRCEKSYDEYVVPGVVDPATSERLLADQHHVPFSASRLFLPATGDACEAVPVGDFAIPHPNTIPADAPERSKAWDDLQDLSTLFLCNKKAQEFFFSRAEHMIRELKDHPGIMAWQLANEPRSFRGWTKVFTRWVERTAKFIKDIDPNHLVSIGAEGELYPWGDYANSDYRAAHDLPGVDYLTVHVWPENWGWYDPALPIDSTEARSLTSATELSDEFVAVHLEHARALNKPAVIEEFGLARDDKESPVASGVTKRNAYYTSIFEHVASNPELPGVNFWAWGGTGRPATDGNPYWRLSNDYIGDPPHEQQGWYSVYDSDGDTLELILEYADRIEGKQ